MNCKNSGIWHKTKRASFVLIWIYLFLASISVHIAWNERCRLCPDSQNRVMWIYECVKYCLINHSIPYSTNCVISVRTMIAAQTLAANNWCQIHIVATVNYCVCPHATSPVTHTHKRYNPDREGRIEIVLLWQSSVCQNYAYRSTVDTSVHAAYFCLFICSFPFFLPFSSIFFRRVDKTAKRDCKLRHACLSICLSALQGTTRLPLEGVSLNFMSEYCFWKLSKNSSFIVDKNKRYVTRRPTYICDNISPNYS
jgi:hypothetical protein